MQASDIKAKKLALTETTDQLQQVEAKYQKLK